MASEMVKNGELRRKTLFAAAKLFLEKGYSNSSTREIAQAAGVNVSAMNRAFGTKENILAELVQYVLEGQFSATAKLLQGITEDKILFYAAETTLQLHMEESCEQVRDLEMVFKESLPHLETKDFYELEIASGGIMRGFMTIPCDMYFTMDRKVARFLETTFLVYRVPDEKIAEAVESVSRFDFGAMAQNVISRMLAGLEEKMD